MTVSLTRQQAREHDRRCIHDLGMPGILLMENAARGCAEIAHHLLPRHAPPVVVVVCGSGQNGGDGFAVARHLATAGCHVRVLTVGEPDPASDAGTMRRIAIAMGVPVEAWAGPEGLQGAHLVVDALLGTGLDRPASGATLEAIRAMRDAGVPVLSVDLPSGMDADTGASRPECVRATITATMAAPKAGFSAPEAMPHLGRVEIVGLGVPGPHG